MKIYPRMAMAVLAVLFCAVRSEAQLPKPAVSLYDDPRVIAWSKNFLDGKREQVIQAVEQDLKSAAPHPFAAHVWTRTQDSLGQLKEAYAVLRDEVLRRALGPLPDIYLLYQEGENKKLLAQYPAAGASEIKDLWALHYLAVAADNEYRRDEAFAYLLAGARLRPDHFQFAWLMADRLRFDFRLLAKMNALVQPGGEFSKTLFGRFVVNQLAKMPPDNTYDENNLPIIEAWLKEQPRDARALRYKGLALDSFNRDEEAIASFQKATEAYPFMWYVREQARALIQLKRTEEARPFVERLVSLQSKDAAAAAPRIAQNWIIALKDTGAPDEAYAVVQEANQRWPEDAALLSERATFELNKEQYTEARSFIDKAIKQSPQTLAYQIQLMEILQRAGYLNDAYVVFVQNEKREQKSGNLYLRGARILEAQTRYEDLTQLCKRAAAEYPGYVWVYREMAFALTQLGRTEEAIAQARIAFDIYPDDVELNRFATNLRKTGGVEKVQTELARLVERYPWLDRLKNIAPAKPALPVKPLAADAEASSETKRAHLVTQLGHLDAITAVAFSPDGRLIVTGSDDTTARLWEAATGKELRRLEGHKASVASAQFSPDGRFIATASRDKSIRIWSVATGKVISQFESSVPVWAIAFSPDGNTVLTGGKTALARFWEAATGKQVRRLQGHKGSVDAIAFSPDGRFIITGSADKTARIWNAATGIEIHNLSAHAGAVSAVAVSPDSRYVLTGSADKTVRLWDAATGIELQTYSGQSSALHSVAFSPDGRLILTAGDGASARLWETISGKPVRRLDGHSGDVLAVAFSKDGKYALTGSSDHTARLWNQAAQDQKTDVQAMQLEGHSGSVSSVAVSRSGRYIVLTGDDPAARIWDTTTGDEIRRLLGHTDKVNAVAYSADDRFIATGSQDQTARIWDAATGQSLHRFSGHSREVLLVKFSPDGKLLLTMARDGVARIFDIASEKELQRFDHLSDWNNTVTFSPDGRTVAGPGIDKTAVVWDATTKESRRLPHPTEVWCMAFSADGKRLATGSLDGIIRVWTLGTGELEYQIKSDAGTIVSIAFSPDGRSIITGSADKGTSVWSAADKTREQVLAHEGSVNLIAFSADGHLMVTMSEQAGVRLWDATTWKEITRFAQDANTIASVTFSPDNQFIIAGSRDGSARLIKAASGEELCRLISFHNKGWAVVDPEGRYDCSNPDGIEGLHWVVSNESVGLGQLKERYYQPQLLAKRYKNEEVRQVGSTFSEVKLFPEVDYKAPARSSTKINISLTNRGGGIGRVRVLVNGKEVAADARGPQPDPAAARLELPVDLAGAAIIPGKPNTIEVIAWNAEGTIASRGVVAEWTPEGTEETRSELYAIVVGISNYASDRINLRYAAKDAESMAAALQLGARKLFGVDKTHIQVLSTSGNSGTSMPTKENIRKAFADARQAKPEDILVVYFAGHGVAVRGENDIYCYLTREAFSTDLSQQVIREQSSVTSDELTDWLLHIPALKRVMILDTCAAGAAISVLQREVSADQIRAMQILKDRTGYFVLMGSAANAPSYEASQFGQGLLTYALLEGMKGRALKDDLFADVSKLFDHAVDRVPELASNIGGIQRPLKAEPKGASFPIGLFDKEERASIQLATIKPQLLRPRLENADEGFDNLKLEEVVRNKLRQESYAYSRGAGAAGQAYIYLGSEDGFPGAILPNGKYTIEGETVRVRLLFIRDGEKAGGPVEISGVKSDLAALAAKVAEKISEIVPTLPKPGNQ